MNTTLYLLTTDGSVRLQIAEQLSDLQYAFLRNASDLNLATEEMRRAVESWARVERLSVRFDVPIAVPCS